MSAISDRLYSQARIHPIKKGNEAEKVTKNADGSMTVTQGNGNTFTLPADAPELQAFVVYTMLNPDCTA